MRKEMISTCRADSTTRWSFRCGATVRIISIRDKITSYLDGRNAFLFPSFQYWAHAAAVKALLKPLELCVKSI